MSCATGCGAPAVSHLKVKPETLRALGVPTAETDEVTLRLCAGCYLRAMGALLDRAGLPKQGPVEVAYWCNQCQLTIDPAAVTFVGSRGVTPTHGPGKHVLQVRPKR